MTRKSQAFVLGISFAIFIAGCNPHQPEAKSVVKRVATPLDPWVITALEPTDTTPALLWNGLVGFRFGRDGGVSEQPYFSIDEYETTGEEKIRSLTSPLPNGFLVDGKTLPITGDYRQSLNMKTSALATHYKSGSMTVDCVTILHPTSRIVSERWTLGGYTPEHALDFDLGVNGKLGKETLLSTDITVGKTGIRGKLLVTQTQNPAPTIEYTLTLARSPNFAVMQKARNASLEEEGQRQSLRAPSVEPFSQVEAEAKRFWAERWKTDIEIDGPVEDQQAVRSFLFYLRSAINPEGLMAISPFGLSNQMYNGHVFWDADIWVFPALAFIDPNEAKAIPDYRISTLPAAEKNPLPKDQPQTSKYEPACRYPWESSVSGKETMMGPSQKELHITGDVAWGVHQAAALGLQSQAVAANIVSRAACFFQNVSFHDPKKQLVGGPNTPKADNTPTMPAEIRDVMSPDENHIGDNDLYTNLLAIWTTSGGKWDVAGNDKLHGCKYKLPHDDKSFLTYDGDPGKGYKQAAAVLSIYPLQAPWTEGMEPTMMKRFADKVGKNGPAMSDSIHAIIWARLSQRDEAYKAWLNSWQPFTGHPLLLFSEKRTKATTYFTTGAAGSLQTVLFGFLGFRLDSAKEPSAAWSKQLQGENWLSIEPNLPKTWKSVKMKNFKVLGHTYTLTATHRPTGPDAAEVIQGD